MKVLHLVGADLSKKNIDFACLPSEQYLRTSNDQAGFKQLHKWLKEQHIALSQLMVVMEHTGLYSYQLERFLHKEQIPFCKVAGLAVKRSMGIIRGKNDRIDAYRLARYGAQRADQLSPEAPVDEHLQRLQRLYSTRERLVRNRAALKTVIKEMQQSCGLAATDVIITSQLAVIKSLDRQIQKLQDCIDQLVAGDQAMEQNYNLLQTIKGVGKVLALATILKTNNFRRFDNARKFACYCGTAPFEHRSGSSIRGKTQVSHLADKKLKTLLDLAAKSAIRCDGQLKDYYQRKIAEGKPKMSAINVVRNKLLYRIFAVIKRQTPYQPLCTAA